MEKEILSIDNMKAIMKKKLTNIKHHLQNNSVSYIVFIDGDNSIVDFYDVIYHNKSSYIILFLSHINYSHHEKKLSNINSPNYIILHPITIVPNAVDHEISILMAELNILIDKSVIFIIISNDKFADEVLERISLDRNCELVTKLVGQFPKYANVIESHKPNPYNINTLPPDLHDIYDQINSALNENNGKVLMSNLGRSIKLSTEIKNKYYGLKNIVCFLIDILNCETIVYCDNSTILRRKLT